MLTWLICLSMRSLLQFNTKLRTLKVSDLHNSIERALLLLLQGRLAFRDNWRSPGTKVGIETGLYPALFWEAMSVESLKNHLLVGCSLVMCGLGCGKLSGYEANTWFSSIWAPGTPFSAENEGGHEHWPRKICISGCCSFGSAFYLIYSASSRARQILQKEQENKSPLQHLLICRSKFILCFSVVESSEWKNSGAAGLAICPGLGSEGTSLLLPQVSPFASNQTNKLFVSQLLSFKMGKLLLSPPGIPCPQISWQLLTVAIWDLEEKCC